MIVNRRGGKCQSCGVSVGPGKGFAYKNGVRWFVVCSSAACMKRLGVNPPEAEAPRVRKIDEDGWITMPYDRDAVVLLRSLPGARWNPDRKQWSASVKPGDLPRVLEVADQLKMQVPDILRAQAAAGTEESRVALERAENARRHDGKTLFEYQKKGVEFLALKDEALLADDMGLGKTVQALVALSEGGRAICIVPAAVKYNWRDEIKMWRPDYEAHVCVGKNSFRLPGPNEIVIVNYDILPKWLEPQKEETRNRNGRKVKKVVGPAPLTEEQKAILAETTVIADEAQKVKNYKAGRSEKVTQLCRAAQRVWFLTGTPLMNRPTDLFGVLSAGNMKPLGSWHKFVELFNGYKNRWGGYEFGMPSPEVPERMKRVMLRRLKTEVMKDLPPKTYQNLEVNDMSAALKKRLNEFTVASALLEGLIEQGDVTKKLLGDDEAMATLASKLEMTSLPSFEEFSEIRALLAEARIPAMLEEVESYEESETPVVVFSAHKAPIKELGRREGWEIITGDTPAEKRTNIVKRFQAGELKGLGLTIQAGGVGITLTRASHALFVDLDWTPAWNIQAEDRICRIGQTANAVLIRRMTSSHPLDKHMQALIEYKMELTYRSLEKTAAYTAPRKRPLAQEIEIVQETEEELAKRIAEAEADAEREVALGKLENIAAREAAKVNDTPEPELTTGRKAMLREALDYMVGRCDGAIERDGMGFNRPDAFIGHWLYATGLREDDDMAFRVLERILVRYRRQLKGQFEEIWKPDLEIESA